MRVKFPLQVVGKLTKETRQKCRCHGGCDKNDAGLTVASFSGYKQADRLMLHHIDLAQVGNAQGVKFVILDIGFN